ncbi:MAG TPA: hypothetical protein VNW29_04290 [Candidatus Sulfotelmatobacter sp.]|jgi:hypothetical protein|nr:hypothetical protein [Candidatus Sulfotelmatobacter sp.]
MKILDYRVSQKPGYLAGHADIEFPTKWGIMQIFNISVLTKNGSRWVSFPQKAIKNEKGEYEYFPLVQMNEKYEQDAFQKQFFPLLDAFLMTNSGPSVHTPSSQSSTPEKVVKISEVPF